MSNNTSNKNLKDFKRKGSRFIPPLKQLPNVRPTSYVDNLLPELIWLGLIHDRHGFEFAAQVLRTICAVSQTWTNPDYRSNLAFQTTYAHLPDLAKADLVAAWKEKELLKGISVSLAPLVLLYDNFALSFVGPPPEVISEKALIDRLKECVGGHLDRYSNKAVILMGYMMLSRIESQTVKLVKGVELPDLNSIYHDPDSDEAQRAAGFIRSTAYAEVGMADLSTGWAEYFWDRGAELSDCEPLDRRL